MWLILYAVPCSQWAVVLVGFVSEFDGVIAWGPGRDCYAPAYSLRTFEGCFLLGLCPIPP